MEVTFITKNEEKLREVSMMLSPVVVRGEGVEIDEIQGSREEIIKDKALRAFDVVKRPLFVEDSSVEFEALNGFPGPYIKDFVNAIGVENIPSLFDKLSNKAKAISMFGFVDETGHVEVFEGSIEGSIVSARGSERFQWDRIFMPQGEDRTFSEMSVEEKNSMSHRARGLAKLREFLLKKGQG